MPKELKYADSQQLQSLKESTWAKFIQKHPKQDPEYSKTFNQRWKLYEKYVDKALGKWIEATKKDPNSKAAKQPKILGWAQWLEKWLFIQKEDKKHGGALGSVMDAIDSFTGSDWLMATPLAAAAWLSEEGRENIAGVFQYAPVAGGVVAGPLGGMIGAAASALVNAAAGVDGGAAAGMVPQQFAGPGVVEPDAPGADGGTSMETVLLVVGILAAAWLLMKK